MTTSWSENKYAQATLSAMVGAASAAHDLRLWVPTVGSTAMVLYLFFLKVFYFTPALQKVAFRSKLRPYYRLMYDTSTDGS